jgi:hypothetical protein
MTAGSEFRGQVVDAFDLDQADPMWTELLHVVCSQLDTVERIEVELAQSSLTVAGSTGQQRANPLLGELRQQRVTLARLLAQLGTDGGESQSERQARFARKRWNG